MCDPVSQFSYSSASVSRLTQLQNTMTTCSHIQPRDVIIDTIHRFTIRGGGRDLWIEFSDRVRPTACDFVSWFLKKEIKRAHNRPFDIYYFECGSESDFDKDLAVNRVKCYKMVGNVAHIEFDQLEKDDDFPKCLAALRDEANCLQEHVGCPFSEK